MPAKFALTTILVLTALGGPTSLPLHGENWPAFRGPTGLGYSTETKLPLSWNAKTGENVLWKTPLVGEGHASPIVWGEHVYVCTARWPAEVKEREKVVPEHHVLCYALADGKLLWDTIVPPGPWLRTDFRSGPGGGYAAPTPVTDGPNVYVVFGSSVMACLDFEGKIAWRREIAPHTFDVTIGGSPVLVDHSLVLLCAMAQKKDSRLAAFATTSGELFWEEKLPNTGFAHSTPVLVNVGGKKQLIAVASGGGKSAEALMGFDPQSGKKLWACEAAGDAASPAVDLEKGIAYVDSGRGGPGFAVDLAAAASSSKDAIKWTVSQVPEGIGSPLIVNGRVYRLHNPGVLKCFSLDSGKELFQQRLDVSSTWASPVADGAGRIYFASGGKSVVIDGAADTITQLGKGDLDDVNHASPAIAHGRMILVGVKNVYCVGTK